MTKVMYQPQARDKGTEEWKAQGQFFTLSHARAKMLAEAGFMAQNGYTVTRMSGWMIDLAPPVRSQSKGIVFRIQPIDPETGERTNIYGGEPK